MGVSDMQWRAAVLGKAQAAVRVRPYARARLPHICIKVSALLMQCLLQAGLMAPNLYIRKQFLLWHERTPARVLSLSQSTVLTEYAR